MKKILLLIIIMLNSINNTHAIKFEYDEVKIIKNDLYFNFPLFTIPNGSIKISSKNEISKINSFSVIEKDSLKKFDDIFEKTHNKALMEVQLINNNNEVTKFFKNKLGEKNFISGLNNNLVNILGGSNGCDNLNFIFNEIRYMKCLFDNYKNIYLNTKNTQIYKINSKKIETIDLFIYPIDYKNIELINHFSNLIDEKNKLSLYDSSLDYYDLKISNKSYDKNTYPRIEKKYKLIKYYKDSKSYTYLIIPFYKVTVDLDKGDNLLKFDYNSYTNDKGNLFYIKN